MPEEWEHPPPCHAVPSRGDGAGTLNQLWKSKSLDPYGNRRTWEKGQFGKTPVACKEMAWTGDSRVNASL